MRSENKADIRRILIFISLSFGLFWIPELILDNTVGFDEWHDGQYGMISAYEMLVPAIANALTRLITKEGWGDSKLHFHLKGNVRYYVLGFLQPIAAGIMAAVTMTVFHGHPDAGELVDRLTSADDIAFLLTNMIAPIFFMLFLAFGEEFGWRGYLYPKLEKAFGTVGSVVIGGTIWGLWHTPLIIHGYNFGSDYAGAPYTGIILMCINCIFIGAILTWLTKKTDSIYPASLMHASNNMQTLNIGLLLVMGVSDDVLSKITPFQGNVILIIQEVILGTVFMILLMNGRKKAEKHISKKAVGNVR